MTVNDTILRFPATVEIFNRFGIDACCGGAAAVADAAVRHGADRVALRTELLRVVGERVIALPIGPGPRDDPAAA